MRLVLSWRAAPYIEVTRMNLMIRLKSALSNTGLVLLCLVLPDARAGVAFTNLYSFTGSSDGGNPYAELLQGIDGNFYGTTEYHGPNGRGTVFKMTGNGALTNLIAFTGPNGANPEKRLLQGK